MSIYLEYICYVILFMFLKFILNNKNFNKKSIKHKCSQEWLKIKENDSSEFWRGCGALRTHTLLVEMQRG